MKGGLKWAIIVVVGGYFLLAGLSKLADTDAFARSILRYQLVGSFWATLAAMWFPWAEVLSAIGLCLPALRKAAVWLLFSMLVVFEVALFSALIRGLDINCGCLGTLVDSGVSFSILRNLVFMAGLLVLVRLEVPSK